MSLSQANLSKCVGPENIVKALDSFIQAMDSMRGVIMVPSRLRDMEVQVQYPGSNGARKSLLAPKNGENGASTTKLDLYSCYSMLYAVHQELTCGDDPEDDPNAPIDELSRTLAKNFRIQLHELFTKLRQFTEVANYLSKRYQDDAFGGMNLD